MTTEAYAEFDNTAIWPTRPQGLLAAPAKPTLRQTRTDAQSEFESLPISRTSRCGKVIGNNLKYDAA